MNEPVPDNPFGLPLDDPRNPLHAPDWRVEKTQGGFTLATEAGSAEEHAQAIEVLKTLLAAGTAPVLVSGDGSPGVDGTGSPSKPGMGDGSRTDVAEWVQSLRSADLATPTIANKASYLKAFFGWLQAAGHYPGGDNPAAGQVKFGVREKRSGAPGARRPF